MKYRLALSRKQFFLFSFLIALVFLSLHAAHQNRYLTLIPDDRDVEPAAKNSLSPASSQQKLIIPLEDAFPETQIVTHVPGWTIFDTLYIFNGTIFVVTSDTASIPEPRRLTSSGYPIFNGPIERAKRVPSANDIQIVTPQRAREIFKQNSANVLDGVSFLVTDPKQFINHYYHWAAELLFGLWRTYSSLYPHTAPDGRTMLSLPKRLMFTHIKTRDWTDYAGMNQWVNRGAFPGMAIETAEDWEDREAMQTVFVLERVVLADRASACEGEPFKKTWRTASNAFLLPGNANWWLPLRRRVLEFTGVPERYIVGPDPGMEVEPYVITYVSRQTWKRRKLIPEDHEVLVRELHALRDQYGYEVNVVSMENLSRAEQILLAARTTILMGVHGNGLTSLIWMRPTRRSTVMEFFIPEGFAFDYEWTTRASGMRHYAFWGDKYITQPDVQKFPTYPEGFQGDRIPLDGRLVAQLVHERLTLPEHELPTDNGDILTYGMDW